VPAAATAGKYDLRALRPGGSTIGTAPFAVIYNPVALRDGGLITTDELRSFAYDESDISHDAWDRDGKSNWNVGQWLLGPSTSTVSTLAIAAIDGTTTELDGADHIRQFANSFIIGDWGASGGIPTVYWDVGPSIPDAFTTAGVTEAEALARSVNASHSLRGECFDFAGSSSALYRSAGIPDRTTYAAQPFMPIGIANDLTCLPGASAEPSTQRWGYHVWNEVFLASPPSGGPDWWVFDATDCAGAQTGGFASRSAYGAKWDPLSVQAEGPTGDAAMISVSSAY